MSDQVKIQATFGWPCLTDKGLRLRYVPHEIVPSPKQAAFLATTCEEALYGGSAGAGKECALTTPILTTEGWATFGDLKVGDHVFDHDGEPTMVTWKSPVSLAPESYRVEMADGETIDCCVDHLWNVTTERHRANWRNTDPRWQAQRRAKRPQRGRTEAERVGITDGRAHGTADSISRLNSALAVERREGRDRPSRWDYSTTMTTAEVIALQGRERQRVAIPAGGALRTTGEWRSACPPYTLGVWLGDGESSSGRICVCAADLAALQRELEADGWIVSISSTSPAGRGAQTQDVHWLRLENGDGRSLREILKADGLLGDKHVPEWVHLAPHADRQAFLGGFCDTDGYASERGHVEFCLANEGMVRDVHSLFWGLGEAPTSVRHRTTRNQVPGFQGEAWRFGLSHCSSYLFRMPRKRDRLAPVSSKPADRSHYRTIKSITPIPSTPMQCIRVDNPRGLFRVGRTHLVTHNTACALMAALQFADVPGYNALIIRRNLTDLKQLDGLIPVSQQWLTGKGPVYNANDHKWTFPTNGAPATIQFGHMANPGSWFRYQGAQAQMVFFDELTQHPDDVGYTYLFSRMRRMTLPREEMIALYGCSDDGLTIGDIPLRMRAATNPGGVGGDWVRKRFVDPDTALAPFLPAFAAENPGIDSEEYARSLARLSEVERRRLQDGDWSVMEIPGALWRFSDIAHPYGPFPSEVGPGGRSIPVPNTPLPEFDYVVVGVDGAVSEGTGDECGIVAIGKTTDGVCAVLEDASLRAHPDDWAKRAVTTYHAHQASRMVIEDNQGGVMNRMIVHNAADVLGVPRPNVILVRAKPGESKEVRAQPVTQAYRAGKVVHGPDLLGSALESQMVSWIPGDKNSISKSPDRVDALVWAIQHALFGAGGSGPIRTTTRTRDRMSSWR